MHIHIHAYTPQQPKGGRGGGGGAVGDSVDAARPTSRPSLGGGGGGASAHSRLYGAEWHFTNGGGRSTEGRRRSSATGWPYPRWQGVGGRGSVELPAHCSPAGSSWHAVQGTDPSASEGVTRVGEGPSLQYPSFPFNLGWPPPRHPPPPPMRGLVPTPPPLRGASGHRYCGGGVLHVITVDTLPPPPLGAAEYSPQWESDAIDRGTGGEAAVV